jgi:hypothetical protein
MAHNEHWVYAAERLFDKALGQEIENGVFWLDLSDGNVRIEFTDADYVNRKSVPLSKIRFCGIEENKQRVVAELKKLIRRVESY